MRICELRIAENFHHLHDFAIPLPGNSHLASHDRHAPCPVLVTGFSQHEYIPPDQMIQRSI